MLRLVEVNRDNIWELLKLSVKDEQKSFVATNVVSIAQSKVQEECIPFGVYNDDIPVGFIMYCMDVTDNEYWIYRLMVDKNHQGKGYGRRAMELIIDKIKEDKDHNILFISFEPENLAAKKLYESMGFVEAGKFVGDEVVYKLVY